MSTSTPSPSDSQLMQGIQAGESRLFGQLVHCYEAGLLRAAQGRLGRRDWAEDVVQETLLAAFKSRMSFKPAGNFRSWLWTILVNQCRRHFRARQRAACVLSGPAAGSLDNPQAPLGEPACLEPTPPARLLAKERKALLERVLAELPPAHADALRLRFFAGLKFHEIAQAMGCSLPTAKNRVRWGLLKMAALLERQAEANNDLEQPV